MFLKWKRGSHQKGGPLVALQSSVGHANQGF